jgi:hypothetical protein
METTTRKKGTRVFLRSGAECGEVMVGGPESNTFPVRLTAVV